MSSRRSEIDAKRQRLAELRRQREEKERLFRSSTPDHSPQVQRPASPLVNGFGDRENIDSLVEQLVGDQSRSGGKKEHRSISIQTDIVHETGTPTSQRVTYNKSTQTEMEEKEDGTVDTGPDTAISDATEHAKPDEDSIHTEATNEPHQLATVEDTVLSSFFTKSFKIINRAIEEDSNHDILQSYSQKKKQALEEAQAYVLLDSLQFDKPIRSIDASPFFPDLITISTGSTVRLYNMAFHTCEYQFDSQTQIIQVQFSQFQSNFIFGTGYNGKVYIWDLESASKLPYLTSMVSSSTHSYPIFSLDQMYENSGVIMITASTDGKILHWDPQILSRPSQAPIHLKVPKSLALRYDELTPWCLTHLKKDSGFLLVGCEDGNTYKVKRFDNKANGEDAINLIYRGHDGPVTAIDSSKDFPHLFVSSGMDWRVHLWDADSEEPLMNIYKSNCIMSCSWRPGHSTQVAYVYEDVLEIMDLSIDCVVPVLKLSCGKTLTGFKFTKSGDKVLLSTFDGQLLIYEVMLQDVKSDVSRFKRLYVAN